MATTSKRPAFKVELEGEFPTADEFERVWETLADSVEFGLDPLLRRIAGPLVDAYETSLEEKVPFAYDDLGLLTAKADALVEIAEDVLRKAKELTTIEQDVERAIECGGKVETPPTFSKFGLEYDEDQDPWKRRLMAEMANA